MTAKTSSARRRRATKKIDPRLFALWTGRFALLIGAGVTLMHSLRLLEEEAIDPALAAVTRDLRARIEGGEHLSQALAHHPDVFPPTYRTMIRAGEIGGVIDVALERLRELTAAGVLERRGRARLDYRALIDWFWMLGTLLISGVPILQALETVAEGSPKGLSDATREMREAVRQGQLISDAMARYAGLFGPTTATLVGLGEVEGSLDQTLLRMADWYQAFLPLEAAGKAPRLTARAAKTPPAPAHVADESSTIIRRVNQLLQEALDLEVDRIELVPAGDDRGTAAMKIAGKRVAGTDLEDYGAVVRRIKIMADINPYSKEVTQGRIRIRYQDSDYEALVHVGVGGLQMAVILKTPPPPGAPIELSPQKRARTKKRKS
jgi:hypothetical protein